MNNRQCEGRVVRRYVQRIAARPEAVFPLLCPVREAEWLEDWTYEMIHSNSGAAEDGCVFRTRPAEGPETIWMVTRHDPVAGVVEFVRVTTGLVAVRLRIVLEAAGAGETDVRITYEFTPISPAGAAFVDRQHAEGPFREAMAWWEKSMNHFLSTGGLLRKSGR